MVSKYNLDALLKSSNTMSEGAGADIWYDAHEHGDVEAQAIIENVQCAMNDIHSALPDLLEAVRLLKNMVNPFQNNQANHDKVLALLEKFETDGEPSHSPSPGL